ALQLEPDAVAVGIDGCDQAAAVVVLVATDPDAAGIHDVLQVVRPARIADVTELAGGAGRVGHRQQVARRAVVVVDGPAVGQCHLDDPAGAVANEGDADTAAVLHAVAAVGQAGLRRRVGDAS